MPYNTYIRKIETLLAENDQDPEDSQLSLDGCHVKCWIFSRGNSHVTLCISDGRGMAKHSLNIEIDAPSLTLWTDGSTPLCLTAMGRSNPILSGCKICDLGFSVAMAMGQINITSTAPLNEINFEVIPQVLKLVDGINRIGDNFALETA